MKAVCHLGAVLASSVVMIACSQGDNDDPTKYMTTQGKAPKSHIMGAGGGGPAAAPPASATGTATAPGAAKGSAAPTGNQPKSSGDKPK
jgi:hypothetical protein